MRKRDSSELTYYDPPRHEQWASRFMSMGAADVIAGVSTKWLFDSFPQIHDGAIKTTIEIAQDVGDALVIGGTIAFIGGLAAGIGIYYERYYERQSQ